MSGKRHKWWGYVKAVIRAYPGHIRDLDALRRPSLPSGCVGVSGGSGIGRPAEAAVLRQLPSEDQRELDAVDAAVRESRRLPDGDARLALIDRIFWAGTHTLDGAAQAAGVSYRTARRWNSDFIAAVAKNLGLG